MPIREILHPVEGRQLGLPEVADASERVGWPKLQ
jgi:hypothetical protein